MSELQNYNHLFATRENIYRQVAANAGISEMGFWILYSICQTQQPLMQSAFADEHFYPRQTVNSAVNRLVHHGLVELTNSPHQRGKLVKLTDAGHAFVRQWVTPVLEADNQVFNRLSASEQQLLIRVMDSQNASLQKQLNDLIERK